jgi:hypothetical protein
MEHGRSGHQQRGIGVRVVLGFRRALGEGDIAGLLGEAGVLGDRNRSAIDRETIDLDLTDRALLGVEADRAYRNLPAGSSTMCAPTMPDDRRTAPASGQSSDSGDVGPPGTWESATEG